MNRYADPHRCPDCGSPITPGQPACRECDLPLVGDTAQQLYTTLLTADRLLSDLRAGATDAAPNGLGKKLTGPPPPAPAPAGSAAAPAAVVGSAAGARGLRGTSVPAILLGLGAACVLVAGLVFLAVAWSAMGVAGRTATLVVFTLAAAGVAALLARRGLRAGAEALAVVALGLLTLDLFGARDAGWFGDPSTGTFLVLLGATLAGAGAVGAIAVRRSRVPELAGAQVAAGLGVGTAVLGIALLPGLATSPALVLSVLTAAVATGGALRLGLAWARWVCVAVLGISWLALLGNAVDRVDRRADLNALWLDLEGWPLLVAAVLAAAPALLSALPTAVRVAAASVGAATAFLLAVFPALDEGPTAVAAVAVTGLVLGLAATRLAPSPWPAVGAVTVLASGLAASGLATVLAGTAAVRLLGAATASWTGTADGRLATLDRSDLGNELASPWMLPVMVAALAAGAVALWSMLPADLARSVPPERGRRAAPAAAGVLLASFVAMLALFPVPVWTTVVASLAASAGLLAWWLRIPSRFALAPAMVLLGGAVAVSRYDELLSALTLSVAVLLTAVVHVRAARPETSAVAGGAVVVALAGATWAWTAVAGASAPWAALTTLVVLAAGTLLADLLPERTWSHDETSVGLAGLEAGAVVSALPVAIAGVLAAGPAEELTWAAVYLTVAGVAVVAVSLLRPDRRPALPAGGLLLAMASWVRLYEIGVRDPEPYTLPGAAVLVALGLYHLRRRPGSGTAGVLGPGLGLALVPSLLWALVEEPGLRALLVGLGCLALVVAGAQLRWTAPLVWGAAAGGVLVTRLAAPYVESTTPTWVLIGAAGALLIALGVTWEQRLSDARQVVGFVRRLR